MPETNPDNTQPDVRSRMTYDKGLGYDKYEPEKLRFKYYISEDKLKIAGVRCDDFNTLPEDALNLATPETRAACKKNLEMQFVVLNYKLLSAVQTDTSCLLKAAVAFHQLLLLFRSLRDEEKSCAVAETLVGIFNEVERRTRTPYQFKAVIVDKSLFRPLPRQILDEFPLNLYGLWKQICQAKGRASRNKPKNGAGLIPLVEKDEKPIDHQKLITQLEIAEANVRITRELLDVPPGDTPLLNDYKANLTKLTLPDVYKQTGISIKNRADRTLSELVEIIYFASSMTLVLDKNGEPFDGDGIYELFPYSMVLSSRKHKTVKFVPPPGKYVSLGPLVDQQFSFDKGIIRKLPIEYHGILGFQEVDVTGQWEPDYQVEANTKFSRNGVYVGSLVTPTAFSPQDITLSSMVSNLPEVVEETMPYFYRAVSKKIESWFENYQDFLAKIVEEVLKSLLIKVLIDMATRYVIKKIGSKIIPVVNVIMAIKDAIDIIGGHDTVRDTIAVNCVRLYLKGTRQGAQDDRTLAVKILANILADAFEDEIKAVIIQQANQISVKLIKRAKPKRSKTSPVTTHTQPPRTLPEPTTLVPAVTGNPKTEPSSRGVSEEIQKVMDAFHQTYKPLIEQRATDEKGNHKSRPEETGATNAPPTRDDKNSEADAPKMVNRKTGDKKRGADDKSKKATEQEDKEPDPRATKRTSKAKPAKSPKDIILLPIFIHTSPEHFRSQLVNFFKNHPKHPLIAVYDARKGRLRPSTGKGHNEFYWESHPEAIQAGHVTSKHTGGPDKIVIMTAAENQKIKSTIEGRGASASIAGGFNVAIIEGIPISVESAKHLIHYGKLDPKALKDAIIVNVDDL